MNWYESIQKFLVYKCAQVYPCFFMHLSLFLSLSFSLSLSLSLSFHEKEGMHSLNFFCIFYKCKCTSDCKYRKLLMHPEANQYSQLLINYFIDCVSSAQTMISLYSVCVCIYVGLCFICGWVYVCMCLCACRCVCVCVRQWMCRCVYMCIHLCMWVCTWMGVYVYVAVV